MAGTVGSQHRAESLIATLWILLVALCMRLLTARNVPPVFDTYGHLYFAKEIKAQNTGPFGAIVTKVIGSTGFRQPFLWHWLVGRFPIEMVLRHQRWINAGIDALFATFVYVVVAQWMAAGVHTGILTASLYLLTPMWFSRLAKGPRISSLTPRLPSELAANVFFMVTLVPLGLPLWLVLSCGSLLAAFVILSSKFGLQALVFLAPLTSVMAASLSPIAAMMLAIVIALAVTKGAFLKSAATQVRHLAWYFAKNVEGGMPISGRNSLRKLFKRPATVRGKLSYVRHVLYGMTVVNSFTSVLIKMPILPVGILVYAAASLNSGTHLPGYLISPVDLAP